MKWNLKEFEAKVKDIIEDDDELVSIRVSKIGALGFEARISAFKELRDRMDKVKKKK